MKQSSDMIRERATIYVVTIIAVLFVAVVSVMMFVRW